MGLFSKFERFPQPSPEKPKVEESEEEKARREFQEYYEKNKDSIDAATDELAKDVLKQTKRPQGVMGNTFLMRFQGDEGKLKEGILHDVVNVKRFVDKGRDMNSEGIKKEEIIPFLAVKLEQVPDSNKWQSSINLSYREVKENRGREVIDGSGTMVGDVQEYKDEQEAKDQLEVRRMVARKAISEFEGGYVEESPIKE